MAAIGVAVVVLTEVLLPHAPLWGKMLAASMTGAALAGIFIRLATRDRAGRS